MSKYTTTGSFSRVKLQVQQVKPENIAPRSLRADLPDKARALLYTVDTVPKGGGLETSRWASAEDIAEIKARRAAGGYDSYHKKLEAAYEHQTAHMRLHLSDSNDKDRVSTSHLEAAVATNTSGTFERVSSQISTTATTEAGKSLEPEYIPPHMRRNASAQIISSEQSASPTTSYPLPVYLRGPTIARGLPSANQVEPVPPHLRRPLNGQTASSPTCSEPATKLEPVASNIKTEAVVHSGPETSPRIQISPGRSSFNTYAEEPEVLGIASVNMDPKTSPNRQIPPGSSSFNTHAKEPVVLGIETTSGSGVASVSQPLPPHLRRSIPIGSACPALPPHLRREPVVVPGNTLMPVAQKHDSNAMGEKINKGTEDASKVSQLPTRPMYMPPHLRHKSANNRLPLDQFPTQSDKSQVSSSGVSNQASTPNKSSGVLDQASTPNTSSGVLNQACTLNKSPGVLNQPPTPNKGSFEHGHHNTISSTEQSFNSLGGVALAGTGDRFAGAKVEMKTDIPTPNQLDTESPQLNVANEERNSGGWTDDGLPAPPPSPPPAPYVEPKIYSDATIKTHSTQKYGSDVWDNWDMRRKPGPVRSLCLSDTGRSDDAATKKRIGEALTEYPDDVIRLNSLKVTYEEIVNHHWEVGRPLVTEKFATAFVQIWRDKLPQEIAIVNQKAAGFDKGLPIDNGLVMDAHKHPETTPNAITDDKVKQETWTSGSAMDRRQKRMLNIARRRQRQKNEYFVPNIRPYDEEEEPPAKPYISIHVRPAVVKDALGITLIYNQWVSNSFIPEDQEEISIENIKSALEASKKESYPFIVAVRGDAPLAGQTAGSEEIVGFAMAEGHSGFGGRFNGRSRSTASIQLYVHQDCLQKGIGSHLLDQLLRRVSRLFVPYTDRRVWVNPGNDPMYEQTPKRFHQILVHRPTDKPSDPDFTWFDAFMTKHRFFESNRALSIARKIHPKDAPGGLGAPFLDVVTYQHEAEIASYVHG